MEYDSRDEKDDSSVNGDISDFELQNGSVAISRRHIHLFWIYVILAFAILSTCLYITPVGIYCVIVFNKTVETCPVIVSINMIHITYWIIFVNTIANILSGLLCIGALGKYGFRSCSHLYIPIKDSERVDAFGAKKFDCRVISVYVCYLFPSIILQIETFWDVGYVEKDWLFASLVFSSILCTTWSAMTIFPVGLDSVADLLENKEMSEKDLSNIEMYDMSTMNTIDDWDQMTADILITNLRENEKGTHYCICRFFHSPRYPWAPLFLFLSFFYNMSWLLYDMVRVTIKLSNPNVHSVFYHLNLVLSALAISFRFFYASSFWLKMLNKKTWFTFYDYNTLKSDQDKNNEYREIAIQIATESGIKVLQLVNSSTVEILRCETRKEMENIFLQLQHEYQLHMEGMKKVHNQGNPFLEQDINNTYVSSSFPLQRRVCSNDMLLSESERDNPEEQEEQEEQQNLLQRGQHNTRNTFEKETIDWSPLILDKKRTNSDYNTTNYDTTNNGAKTTNNAGSTNNGKRENEKQF